MIMNQPKESMIPMEKIRISVFGSSSDKTPKQYIDMAYDLGALIAKNDCVCVNGGGCYGVMGQVCFHFFPIILSIITINVIIF